MELSQCSKWKGIAHDTALPDGTADDILLPWTGGALGLSDLNFITGRAKPIIVGIAGPESAGKTTLLAAWYLLLGRSLLTDNAWRFGGSFSLGGWEAVAAALRWSPGQMPSFPAHTTSRGARAPGLLHLAFRRMDDYLRDLLFADAPGEWFQRWSVDANAEDAEGARWIAQHADVLLLVADRQALSGSRLGSARNAFQLLATRIAAERRGRPVALVWTKADVGVAPEMEGRIRQAVISAIPDAAEFSVSILSADGGDVGAGFQELFHWVLGTHRPGTQLPLAAPSGHDPLFVFGRR
ncbi:MAG: TRAFAC clade GTPase domain-containing protein [Moraxellaceae bacterium]